MDTQIKIKIVLFAILSLFCINIAFAQEFKAGTEIVYYPSNAFSNDPASLAGTIIPAIMLIVGIVFALIDFGAIGVCLGGILAMIFLSILGIIGLTLMSVVAYIVLGALIIFKLIQ